MIGKDIVTADSVILLFRHDPFPPDDFELTAYQPFLVGISLVSSASGSDLSSVLSSFLKLQTVTNCNGLAMMPRVFLLWAEVQFSQC
jgi:hypothetical protein